MSSEPILWVLAYFAYVTAGFVAFFAGKEIGRKIIKKERGEVDEATGYH